MYVVSKVGTLLKKDIYDFEWVEGVFDNTSTINVWRDIRQIEDTTSKLNKGILNYILQIKIIISEWKLTGEEFS